MFDFDNFINKVCVGQTNEKGELKSGIFGRKAQYIPYNENNSPFFIMVDFHESFQEIQPKTQDIQITSCQTVAFIRICDMPPTYKTILQGDFLEVGNHKYQIFDVQHQIPGLMKVVLRNE